MVSGRLASLGGQGDPLDVFRLRTIIGESEAAIRTLEAKAVGKYDKAAQDAADLAIEHVGDELDRLSTAFDAKPLDVSIDAQAVLADPAQGLLASHYATSVERYGGELLNGVRQRLFIGLRAGDTVSEVARAVAGQQGPFGALGRSNAERLVRTEVSHAYGAANHKAQVEAAKEVPGLKKVWLHVGSFLCPTCGPLHGTERPLDGTWTVKSRKRTHEVMHAPAHPRCTCRTSTMKPPWRSGLKRLGYLGDQPDDGEHGKAEL